MEHHEIECHANTYEDTRRAAAFDQLGLSGTYALVFQNLPSLVRTHVHGNRAIDFGCGTGRSTRFLASLGLEVLGLDISAEMIARARARDPRGAYQVLADGDLAALPGSSVDLVLAAFTFDNIPGFERKVLLFSQLRRLLRPGGRLVNIVSTPEIYTHEWVTFTTRAFPENRTARTGDIVRIITTEYDDPRPVEDILWPDNAYRAVYRNAGLQPERTERPLATGDEGIAWVTETHLAPWAIYVLRSAFG